MSKRTWSWLAALVLGAGIAAAVGAADPGLSRPGWRGVVGVGVENGQAAVVVFTARQRVAGIPASLDGVRSPFA